MPRANVRLPLGAKIKHFEQHIPATVFGAVMRQIHYFSRLLQKTHTRSPMLCYWSFRIFIFLFEASKATSTLHSPTSTAGTGMKVAPSPHHQCR